METTLLENIPNLVLKEITVRDVYEALKKNGFEWLRGEWFKNGLDENDGTIKPVGGCVLGQAALNLGVFATSDTVVDSFFDWLYRNHLDSDDLGFQGYSLESQLNKFTIPKTSKWYTVGFIQLADAIIRWNDDNNNVDGKVVYTLKTYKEVEEVAYELMEPFFDEKIKVLVINREIGLENK